MVTDVRSILRIWRKHFSNWLNGDSSAIDRMELEPESTVIDYNVVVPPVDQHEVRIAIAQLKNNKAAGLSAELVKHDGEELVLHIHQLLY